MLIVFIEFGKCDYCLDKCLSATEKNCNGQAPSYISDLLKLHAPIRSVRSADKLFLYLPRSRCRRTSDRAFAVTGPKLWKQLPLSIRQASSLSVFKSRLKPHLFVQVGRGNTART